MVTVEVLAPGLEPVEGEDEPQSYQAGFIIREGGDGSLDNMKTNLFCINTRPIKQIYLLLSACKSKHLNQKKVLQACFTNMLINLGTFRNIRF